MSPKKKKFSREIASRYRKAYKLIVELRQKGLKQQEIADELTKLGVPKSITGESTPWRQSIVSDMLLRGPSINKGKISRGTRSHPARARKVYAPRQPRPGEMALVHFTAGKSEPQANPSRKAPAPQMPRTFEECLSEVVTSNLQMEMRDYVLRLILSDYTKHVNQQV